MNRQEADIFESIFLRRRILERIDPEMDAMEVLQSYEDYALPDALEKLTYRIIRGLDLREQGSMNERDNN